MKKNDPFFNYHLSTKLQTQIIRLTFSITKTKSTKFPNISRTNQYRLFHIPILHLLHLKFSILKGYCRTSRLRTSVLNNRTVLAKYSFKYGTSVVMRDLSIIENESPRKVLSSRPKYRELRSINWNYKQEQEDIDSLSEWVKAVRSLILKRIKILSR